MEETLEGQVQGKGWGCGSPHFSTGSQTGSAPDPAPWGFLEALVHSLAAGD